MTAYVLSHWFCNWEGGARDGKYICLHGIPVSPLLVCCGRRIPGGLLTYVDMRHVPRRRVCFP